MKVKLLILLLVLISSPLLKAQYTSDAELVNTKTASVILRSSGLHEKKKEAIQMAIKSAFDTYFFVGIKGVDDNGPLIGEANRAQSASYLERLFDDKTKKYMSFIGNVSEGDQNKVGKLTRATVTLELFTQSLIRDLIRNKVISGPPPPPGGRVPPPIDHIADVVSQPTIVVVPTKQSGRSYDEIIKYYIGYRTTINMVQGALVSKGYEIKDFMAALEATEKRHQMSSGTAVTSFEDELIANSAADVYIEVDAGYSTDGDQGSIGLKAYEKSTARVLAAKQHITKKYPNSLREDLYRIAINSIIDPFLTEMTKSYNDKALKGNTFVLVIQTGNDSASDLDTNVPSQGLPLSDVMRRWVRKNAVGGNFHILGATRNKLTFDGIKIASKAKEGYFIDANDFALDIWQYIKNDLGVNCEKMVDGTTVYITIVN